jgi:bifunctional non-homologous end joining protein LigD
VADPAAGAAPAQGQPQERITPMLATLTTRVPPDDENWAFEFKWDGVRALVFVDGEALCVQGRRTDDITQRYPELAGIPEALGGRRVVLDGEIVALDEKGRPSFQLLQHRMGVASSFDAKRRARDVPAFYLAFDVLALDGDQTMALPYTERRRLLDGLGLAGAHWRAPPSHTGDGQDVLDASRASSLEGIVAKRLDSPYEPGRRSRCWLKIKNVYRQEFVIGGWSEGEGVRSTHFGSLLVGYYDGDDLRYAGNVGTGFTDRMLKEMMGRLGPLRTASNPFTDLPKLRFKNVVFVEPRLVADVEYREWTADGRLRAPAFKGLRDDKDPREVVREEPV